MCTRALTLTQTLGTPCIYTDSTGDCLLVFTVLRKSKGEALAEGDRNQTVTDDGQVLIPHRLLFVFQVCMRESVIE